ncbi:dentin sialophosphoprotein isoform X2 [Eupeodes corollae]|uniref:dentin sialophosphoprotein isoform X2 n=1 Tax=Eupeodes corollae TaxID=290404 RepID=UPI0024937792|nr:dentin sialophosphoprotein isoform X2 [Eupeodes corollae]
MNTNSKMSSSRSSPASPRLPKFQQQTWDSQGCSGAPKSPRSPKVHQQAWESSSGVCSTAPKSPHRTMPNLPQQQPFKSPKSPRHFKNQSSLNCYETPRSPSISTYSSYSYDSASSRKFENPPRSPKITTTFANDDSDSNLSYYQTPSPISRSPKALPTLPNESPDYYMSGQMSQSPSRSPHPHQPRKFVFDTPPSSSELPSAKKFEYYEPQTPDDDDDEHHITKDLIMMDDANYGHGHSQFQHSLPMSPYKHSRHNSLKGFGKPRPKESISVLPEIDNGSDLFTYQKQDLLLADDPNRPGNNAFLKRDSCVTESTQISMDSSDTNNTSMTTATTLSSDNSGSQGPESRRNAMHGNNMSDSHFGEHYKHENQHRRLGRRHAINITSNPGYQILHSSHSTLDRTCSDSVVSLRCRKSTSDLTYDKDDISNSNSKHNGSSNNHGNNSNGVSSNNPKPRRRGSSKGGLAYLASRRNSRESMKSACSNTSIFSNDDIGPLAFQASTRGRQRRTSNFLELPVPDHVRPRVCSLPDRPYNPRLSDDLYRLRHFSISKGNVVNCGDSIISRRSRSNTSVNSTNSRASERSPFDGSCCGGGYANVDSIPPSPDTDDSEPPPPPRYRIVMLGDAGVGKTALVSQFMTSEYMHTYDASLDDEFGEKTVSVLLDDEESELVFIDHPSVEMSVENSLTTYEPHGCVVVFSVVDKTSFRIAEEIINYLWKENITKDKAVILVGNKADLARARVISTQDGKSLAASRDAKFIETSSGIQHNVDELLVGTLKQIRLKENREKKATSSRMKTSRTHISLHLAKEILQKICLSDITKSKSCENLHVL